MDDGTGLAQAAGPCAVDALLASSRALTAITTRLLEPAAGETTSAQYRVLAVLALHDPMRMTDLSAALEILPSSAARLCDRLAHEGLIQRQRAPGNRRVVLVSVTAAGRQAAIQVTARRRALIAEVLARLPPDTQRAAAEAFFMFAQAAREPSGNPGGLPYHHPPRMTQRSRPRADAWRRAPGLTHRPGEPAAPSDGVPGTPWQVNGHGKQGEGTPILRSTPGQAAPEQPTMILRPAVSPVTHVVVGVDGSAGSEAALRWAAAEAVRRQTGLRIVSAWQEPARTGSSPAGHPAQAAAHILQEALARFLSQQHYPLRIACAGLRGTPGKALLTQARGSGLLVLGATGAGPGQVPGATGTYCLQHGSGPLVIVPAAVPRIAASPASRKGDGLLVSAAEAGGDLPEVIGVAGSGVADN